jgi:hypothetical protein
VDRAEQAASSLQTPFVTPMATAEPIFSRMAGAPVHPVEEISLTSVPTWIRRTVAQDRRFHARAHRHTRPLTVRRVVASLYPRLERPVFIVGAPRSGTTFLGECIAALPEASYHFEPVATKAAGRCVFVGSWGYWRSRFAFRSMYRLLLLLHANGDLRFVEKTPQNCFLISFLARAFPDARFVHILRDGRDAAVSYSKKPWLLASSTARESREAGGYLNGPHARYWVEPERRVEFEKTTDFHRCIWAWRLHTEWALRHAAALAPATYHELRYEDLMARPVAEGARLLKFLEISNPCSIERFEEALQRCNGASVGRWRRELTPAQLHEVETEAGALLRRLGYVPLETT